MSKFWQAPTNDYLLSRAGKRINVCDVRKLVTFSKRGKMSNLHQSRESEVLVLMLSPESFSQVSPASLTGMTVTGDLQRFSTDCDA